MKKSRFPILLTMPALLLGCSGTLYTAHDVKKDEHGNYETVEGVIAYHQVSVYELYELRAYLDEASKNSN